jgi:hypothetical protein
LGATALLNPRDDIARIKRALRPQGKLFVVNMFGRAVPTLEYGYVSDNIDVRPELGREFLLRAEGALAKEHVTSFALKHSFWATFQVP